MVTELDHLKQSIECFKLNPIGISKRHNRQSTKRSGLTDPGIKMVLSK